MTIQNDAGKGACSCAIKSHRALSGTILCLQLLMDTSKLHRLLLLLLLLLLGSFFSH
jgi:hypothetical protein